MDQGAEPSSRVSQCCAEQPEDRCFLYGPGLCFTHASGAWNWVLSPGLSQWSAQMVEVCETMAESSVMHRSSASTKAGTDGMEDSR